MQLKSHKAKIVQSLNYPGLIEGGIEYDIAKGTSNLVWKGPRIAPSVWLPILAFFQDTYNRTKSECQVRLYVNTVKREWAAWAYPQEARSGMAAKELVCPDATAQREQFKESEGWTYSGTVHHHCAAGAFQSDTDRENEQNQDGLHVTIGDLDKDRFSIHARFYCAGAEFLPDLSAFWDIGEPWTLVPAGILNHDALARLQMTQPVPAGTEYPDKWKENLIEIQIAPVIIRPEWHSPLALCDAGMPDYYKRNGGGRKKMAENKRKEYALRQLKNACKAEVITDEDLRSACLVLLDNPAVKLIRQAATGHNLSIFDVLDEWNWEQGMLELKAEQEQLGNEIGTGWPYNMD